MTAKVIRFHDGDASTAEALAAAWHPCEARVAVAAALVLPGLPPPRYAAVDMVWSDDDGAGWPGDPALVVPVEDEVRRGRLGAERYTMMSVARRHPALSRAEFAARWRAEAGRLGTAPIPDAVRGVAYVQDHPTGDDPPVDAINEAWFADLAGLRQRADWFAARPVPADLFDPAASWALYLRFLAALIAT